MDGALNNHSINLRSLLTGLSQLSLRGLAEMYEPRGPVFGGAP
jgi:hypothetical protein